MSDLTSETVKQAIELHTNPPADEPIDFQAESEAEDMVVDAAGRWAEGTPIQWCEVHESTRNIRTAHDHGACDRWWMLADRGKPEPEGTCRFVERRLCQ